MSTSEVREETRPEPSTRPRQRPGGVVDDRRRAWPSGPCWDSWSFGGPVAPPPGFRAFDDLPRRLVRLGHIAAIALPALNLLYVPWMARSRWGGATRRDGLPAAPLRHDRSAESPRAGGLLGSRTLLAPDSRGGADRRRLAPGGRPSEAGPRPAGGRVPMRIGLIAMSGVRVRTAELAALGVTLPGLRPPWPGDRPAAEPRASHRGGAHAPGSRGHLPRGRRPPEPRPPARVRSRGDLQLHRPDRGRLRAGRPLPGARACPSCWAASTSRSCRTRRSPARRRGGGRRRRRSLAARPGRRRAGSAGAPSTRGRARASSSRGSMPSRGSTSSTGGPYNRVTVQSSRGCPARVRVLRREPPDHVALQPEAGGPRDRRDPRRARPRRGAVLRAGGRQHVPRPALGGGLPPRRDAGGDSLLHRDRRLGGRRPGVCAIAWPRPAAGSS